MPLGLIDTLKISAGATLGAAAMFAWASFIMLPTAERTAREEGRLACEAAVAKEHAAELARQETANAAALERARQRETEMAEQAETHRQQLLDLANAITADDRTRVCLSADRVRDLNTIR